MPLSTSDSGVPRRSRASSASSAPVPDAPAADPAAPSEEAPPLVPVLRPASEASTAEVHALLAERQGATDAGDEAAALSATSRLAELGYR